MVEWPRWDLEQTKHPESKAVQWRVQSIALLPLRELLQSPHCSLMFYWLGEGHSEGTMSFKSKLVVATQILLTVNPGSLEREPLNP